MSENNPFENLGRFRITYYCNCDECSEGYGRLTSTGHICHSDYTIAVDPDVIPYGKSENTCHFNDEMNHC